MVGQFDGLSAVAKEHCATCNTNRSTSLWHRPLRAPLRVGPASAASTSIIQTEWVLILRGFLVACWLVNNVASLDVSSPDD
jgi:hypothetical protein